MTAATAPSNQAAHGQRLERFADGGSAHAEIHAQAALGREPVAGVQFALHDLVLQIVSDFVDTTSEFNHWSDPKSSLTALEFGCYIAK